jgi:hypothetical protein
MRILNFGDKSATSKCDSNWGSNISLERSSNINMKNRFTFFISSCVVGVMDKRVAMRNFLLLTIKTPEANFKLVPN